jgi:hypothetical protein
VTRGGVCLSAADRHRRPAERLPVAEINTPLTLRLPTGDQMPMTPSEVDAKFAQIEARLKSLEAQANATQMKRLVSAVNQFGRLFTRLLSVQSQTNTPATEWKDV